ncbi:indolepyruvate ferredoxin oxidoreductase family protein [Massilia sp. CCM 8734]|uniref:indolepyruvate ferredoxin oxidoreductase family protein n=1 Tax=Massilia sp. CCM 8734 TaxID=2609283 RepID=UPI00142136C0|nr:indolepyruvate ferredoxin oxidoreductase family protein [Massilia sp. CCM 8734]NIA00725.1 indolepyruvate ferredoxin oxidoreductase family protein [Massilia sp. CCM 8734]
MGNLNEGLRGAAAAAPTALADYRLIDSLSARGGRIYLTGTQALVRLLIMQRALDKAAGLNTAGFVSGYRGSPLGGVDQQLWKNQQLLRDSEISFLPAINEELGATAVLGTQRIEGDSERTVEGVFAMWYGKGPGVDRAADALKHGNAYGASRRGGVLVVAGDDHGCVSSSMSHQSELTMMAWHMPVLNPSNVEEILEFGLYGWALSRFCGAWVGLKAISETVESAGTIDLDVINTAWTAPPDHVEPAGGLHNRWPDFPGPQIEVRMLEKLHAACAFARHNGVDKWIARSAHASVGIVSCGKAHLDLMEALRRLGLGSAELERAGVRVYKVGQSFPLELSGLDSFVDGLSEILVIEEKAAVVERQIKEHLYNRAAAARPRVIGKADLAGDSLLSSSAELRPSRILPVLAAWLAEHKPALDRRELAGLAGAAPLLSNAADGVRRTPYFCSGCSHNVATKVPQGSIAHAGIGCHFMASWMNRDTTGLIQMGGEGVDWVAQSRFSTRGHIFQNLGDGTYFHSGILAIRQAVAADANITYKVLHNAAVAMTGGQPIDGNLPVPRLAHQLVAEGVKRLAIVSDDADKYKGHERDYPARTSFHHRDQMDALQRELREIGGVTALIYDQGCAAEKRRLRKQGKASTPNRRLFINESVCEGCGDCGAKSNCLSVGVTETALGRKRKIDQSSCNLDFSCQKGSCPSFVSLVGAVPKKSRAGMPLLTELESLAGMLPEPPAALLQAPYNVLVTGVGGSGVVTVGALISMAAHLEGKQASVLDFMGFSQKGGAVLSFVRLAGAAGSLNQVRIDVRQADLLLACDMVVAASPDALQTLQHGRTRVALNLHAIANASFVQNPDANLHQDALQEKIRHAAGPGAQAACDAQQLAEHFLGDTIAANIIMLGMAWQRGWIPVSLAALARAIELNGVAVPLNKRAFAIGRLAAAEPEHLARAMAGALAPAPPADDNLELLIARHSQQLQTYGGGAYVRRYRALLATVRAAEQDLPGAHDTAFSMAVARNFARLLMVKDEYEVARMYGSDEFHRDLERQFEGVPGKDYRIEFHMSPPLGRKPGAEAVKRTFGQWMLTLLKVMAALRRVRGSWLDPFRLQQERRMEQELVAHFERQMRQVAARLNRRDMDAAIALAELPSTILGFGHVKLRNLARAKAREASLAGRLGIALEHGPLVAGHLKHAASEGSVLRGIPIVKA